MRCILEGFQGVIYPSTRQRCVFARAYKNFTRQITRQEASGYPSGGLGERPATAKNRRHKELQLDWVAEAINGS